MTRYFIAAPNPLTGDMYVYATSDSEDYLMEVANSLRSSGVWHLLLLEADGDSLEDYNKAISDYRGTQSE